MARKLKEEYEKRGLYINIEKTKCLCIGEERENITFDNGEELKSNIECTYLGIKLVNSGNNTLEIKNIIAQAISALNSIWWNKNITKNKKLQIY